MSHIYMQINWEEQLGSEKDHSVGKESLKLQQREKLPASQESSLERPTGPWNVHKMTYLGSAPEGPNLLLGMGKVTEILLRAEQPELFPL